MSDAIQAAQTRRTSRSEVLGVIRDMHNQEQIITRETLAAQMDLPMRIIDDNVGALCDSGQVARVQRGVYVPTEVHPIARVCSVTMLPDGTVKLDIGDEVLTLTPKEARIVATMLSGHATQYASIEIGHNAALMAADLRTRINKLERDIAKS